MNIWLISAYGPIPGEAWRDYRFPIIAEVLATHGHQVTWWTANFSHHFKRFRSESWRDISVAPGFQVRLVPTSSYRRHIGLGRLRFEALFAWRLYHRAVHEAGPDWIIATDPPQAVGYAAQRIARHHGASLIIDVMDLWPELFTLAFPRILRPLAPVIFSPLYALRRHNLSRAHAATALCKTYLEVVQREAPHLDGSRRRVIFNGIDIAEFRAMAGKISDTEPPIEPMAKPAHEVWAIYAGTLGNNYDVETLLQAALQLQQRSSNVRILIAGDGPLRPNVTNLVQSGQLANVTYLGKMGVEQLVKYYQLCDIGLCAYGPDSNVAMPDKAYDYMAAGLPIVNSLRGELEDLLRENRIGVQYTAGDATSLANTLELLASDEERRRLMACRSFNAAVLFDKAVQYSQYLDLVQQA